MQHPCHLEPLQLIAMQLLDLFRQAAAREGLYVGIVRNTSRVTLVVCQVNPEGFDERQGYIDLLDQTRTVLSGVVVMCPEGLISHAVSLTTIQEAPLLARQLLMVKEAGSEGR